jgi:hypothetical protein
MSPTWIILLAFALFIVPVRATYQRSTGRHSRGFFTASVDALPVVAAKAFVQNQLAILRIDQVLQAATKVEAGLNVRLICRVLGEGEGPTTWEFLAYRTLGGAWVFRSARMLQRVP